MSSIARLLGVSRATIYKYVPELAKPTLSPAAAPPALPALVLADQPAASPQPMPSPPRSTACPTCGNRPTSKHELQLHREGLETVWLLPDPYSPDAVIERWHCERCQPHQARIVMCGLCSATVMLGEELGAGDPAQVARCRRSVARRPRLDPRP